MKRIAFLLVGAALALSSGAPARADGGTVTVFAAASLREAFEAAGPAFTKKTGYTVVFNFAGSDTLATQIAQGAPADVFASANVTQMDKLASASLLGAAPSVFARNQLVVIVPKTNPAHIAAVSDLATPGVHVVLAAPTVPVGAYARTAFTNLHLAGAIEKNVVSNEVDVKAVATKIVLGEGDAGVVYSTDVTPAIAEKVLEISFPEGAVKDAVYPIAVVKHTPPSPGAAAFVDFILHDGQAYLRARGFIAP